MLVNIAVLNVAKIIKHSELHEHVRHIRCPIVFCLENKKERERERERDRDQVHYYIVRLHFWRAFWRRDYGRLMPVISQENCPLTKVSSWQADL